MRFVDRTAAAGLDFVHRHFGTGEKWMPENMGPGVLVADLDGDGRLDVYVPQGAPLVDGRPEPSPTAENRFYRQLEGGRFEDATAAAGLGDRGYGMGAYAGDVDRDGDLDVYVTNYGRNTLYRNLGGGRFEDVTEQAGVGSDLWSTGASFFDADGDGDLDLYVANYVDFSPGNHRFCGNARRQLRSYCHPDVYGAQPDVFYRNAGDGTFRDETLAAGFRSSPTSVDPDSKGLGVLATDLDGDRRPDVMVANDSTMNFLFVQQPDGRFIEGALLAGVGFNADGRPEASMGIAQGDVDGDRRLDLLLTHLDNETNTLYRSSGDGQFVDATRVSGLGSPSLPWVGFGTVLFDADLDGDLDLVVGNGHIIDNIALFDRERQHRQPLQLFLGAGDGTFRLDEGAFGTLPDLVARGVAAADLDGDGDEDLIVAQNDGPALLLENVVHGRSLTVRLVPAGGVSPIGARAVLETSPAAATRVAAVVGGSSYLSQMPDDLVFGLGDAEPVALQVTWPDGSTSRHAGLRPGRLHTVSQGKSEIATLPFAPRRR